MKVRNAEAGIEALGESRAGNDRRRRAGRHSEFWCAMAVSVAIKWANAKASPPCRRGLAFKSKIYGKSWLGREDSNLRMAESKSAQWRRISRFRAASVGTRKFSPLFFGCYSAHCRLEPASFDWTACRNGALLTSRYCTNLESGRRAAMKATNIMKRRTRLEPAEWRRDLKSKQETSTITTL